MTIQRICVCSTRIPFVRGGSEIFLENLVSHLRQRGKEVEEILLPLQTHPHEELLKSCLAWRMLNLETSDGYPIDLVIGTRFPSYMIPHPNKIVWLQLQFRQIYDMYGTEFSDFKTTPKDNEIRHHLMDLDEIAFREAKKIFSQSKTVANRLKQHNGFDSTVLYPPVEDAEKFQFSGTEDFVLSVARLSGNKRVHLLIEAMAKVRAPFRAVIIGDGVARPEYEQLAKQLGIAGRIEFVGALPRVQTIEWYSRAGAVFYGPFDEDYGYATIESFHARKPVITCTDSGGVLEFVDPSTGWIAPPQPDAIASCIEEALSNKTEAKRRGESGHERISFLNWNYVLDHLLAEE